MPSFIGLGSTTYLSPLGAESVVVTIVRTGDLDETVDVTFLTNDYTATANEDYVPIPDGVVRFDPGVTEVAIEIDLLPDPLDPEAQSFSLTLVDASGDGSLQTPRTAQIVLNSSDDGGEVFPIDTLDVGFLPVVTDIQRPTDIAFMPNDPNTFLVGQQPGIVSIVQDGVLLSTPLLDMSYFTNFVQDRGLTSIAIHPDIENHPYLYVAAVIDPPDVDRTGATATTNDDPDGRGSRYAQILQFELDPATNYTTIVPGTEIAGARQVILGADVTDSLDDVAFRGIYDYGSDPALFNDPVLFPASGADRIGSDFIRLDSLSHAPGDMIFDATGNLIITIGDGTAFNYADPRAVGETGVQNPDILNGKVVRIDPLTGLGLPDNPFADGTDGLGDNVDKVYQIGVRNSFRGALREDGVLFLGDVGWNTFEEINAGAAGANFGWPFYEGGLFGELVETPVYRSWTEADAFYDAVAAGTIEVTAPRIAFSHLPTDPGFQANALMAGDFFQPGGPYPSFLDGYLLFGDIVSGRTFVLDTQNPKADPFLISDAAQFVVDWTVGPDGRMWYASLFGNTVGYLQISGTLPPTEPTARIDFGGSAGIDVADFTFNGSAALVGEALRLTPEADRQAGSVFYSEALTIDADTSFTTQFSFEVSNGDGTNLGGDGFAFVLQNDTDGALQGANALGGNGWTLGYGGRPGAEPITNSLAITFDTFRNPFDVSSNQIALLLDGRAQNPVAAAALPLATFDINGGGIGYAWVDYDGVADRLEVFVGASSTKPGAPALVVEDVQLDAIVGERAYAGFTASTGNTNNYHDIVNWTFIQDPDLAQAPRTLSIAATDAVAAEGSPGTIREFLFTVTRSGDLAFPTMVDWNVNGIGSDGGADGDDFVGGVLPSGRITFTAGQASQTLAIAVRGDVQLENDEVFRVTLSNADNATIPFGFADGIILNDDVAGGVSFAFPSFPTSAAEAGLNLNGSASLTGGALQLTPGVAGQRGSAFLDQALVIGPDSSFHTDFSFQLNGGSDGGSGFTFVLQNDPSGSDALGWRGYAMGLHGRNAGERITNSLAITFDTFQDSFDVSSNQIALILDGRVPFSGAPRVDLPTSVLDLNGEAIGHAWIEYDGMADRLEVFVGASATKPGTAVLVAENLQLDAIVGDRAYAGFTAATPDSSSLVSNAHRILDWQFAQDRADAAPPPFLAYSDFVGVADLALNGAASLADAALRLTPPVNGQAGSAFHTEALPLTADTSFATQFTFRTDGGTNAGDGFAFVVQNDTEGARQGLEALGGDGWTLGLGGRGGVERITSSLAITFDTFQNPFDVSSNQIGLVLNGAVQNADATRVDLPLSTFDLNSGDLGYAWIDYDGPSDTLRVFVGGGPEKPEDPVLTAVVDLAGLVGNQAYVGFTAATGGLSNQHDIVSWLMTVDDPLLL